MPYKPDSVNSSDTFLTWRLAFNSLLGKSVTTVYSAVAPTVNDDQANYENSTIWIHTTPNPNEGYLLLDNAAGAAVWLKLGSTEGAMLNDGSVPLTGNWDVGAYTIQATQFISDIPIGTAPLVVTSTTKVTNLNSDLLDDQDGTYYLARANHTGTQSSATITGLGGLSAMNTVGSAQIDNDAVNNTKLSNMAAWTLKIRNDATTGDPTDTKISTLALAAEADLGGWLLHELSTGELRRISPAAGLADNSVTTVKIVNGAVTADKLATDAVITTKILNANVTTAKIADNNVTTAKILDSNVTTTKIADNNVTTAKILNGAVTADKLATDAVITTKILNANVTTAKIADNNVTDAKLADMAAWTLKLRNAGTSGDPSSVKISALTTVSINPAGWLLHEVPGGELRKVSAGAVGGLVNDVAIKTATFTAVAGTRYFVETDTGAGSASNVIVNCPTSPAPGFGDTFEVFHVGIGDVATPAANEALHINPGASYRIMGAALDEDLRIDKIGAAVRLIYTTATYGWRVATL